MKNKEIGKIFKVLFLSLVVYFITFILQLKMIIIVIKIIKEKFIPKNK